MERKININGVSEKNLLKLCFIDTETTGTDCMIHGIHQLSMIMETYDLQTKERRIIEKINLHMKPFDECLYDEEALNVSGVTKEQILEYPSEQEIFLQFRNILDKHCNKFDKKDKYYFVGYNSKFDKDMCYSWFLRNGEKYFFSYFFSNDIDVMTLITPMLFLERPNMINFRLGTVSKMLNIEINDESLHDAMFDLEITEILFWKYIDRFNNIIQNKSSEKDDISKKIFESNIPSNDLKLGTITKKQKYITLDTIFDFGKHKGKKVSEIIETDASYILWIGENHIKDFYLEEEFKNSIKNIAEKQFQDIYKKLKENTYNSYIK